jgi:hypothetical protein
MWYMVCVTSGLQTRTLPQLEDVSLFRDIRRRNAWSNVIPNKLFLPFLFKDPTSASSSWRIGGGGGGGKTKRWGGCKGETPKMCFFFL